jgi:hypothetical protein
MVHAFLRLALEELDTQICNGHDAARSYVTCGFTLVELLLAGLSDVDHKLSALEYLISIIVNRRENCSLFLTTVRLSINNRLADYLQ